MLREEKSRLLALLDHAESWCRHAEAVDSKGEGVVYDDEQAVAWDITGALCHLFGWKRASVLFEQCARHFVGKRSNCGWPKPDPIIDAMRVLQDFNDDKTTTYDSLRAQLETLPVWSKGRRSAIVTRTPPAGRQWTTCRTGRTAGFGLDLE